MATVEIPDDVYEALRRDAKSRLRTDDPADMIVQVLGQHLRDACAPGFVVDGLTGLPTRHRLRERIRRATFGTAWTDSSLYCERFLCVDLDNFKKYLDLYGLMDGDVVLRDLALGLRGHFGADDVYRYGGDEFVVVLGERAAWVPEMPLDMSVAYSVVNVALHRNQRRNDHIGRWIDLHLDAGVLASTPEGTGIDCGDPVWLQRR